MVDKPWKTTSNNKYLYCKKIYIVSEQAKTIVGSGLALHESRFFFIGAPSFCVTIFSFKIRIKHKLFPFNEPNTIKTCN